MNTLLLFFAFPVATVLLAIVLQKILKNPILVAITFFAVYLIVAFAAFDETFLVFAIVYTILAFITAAIVEAICKFIKKCLNNNNNCNHSNNESANCVCCNLENINNSLESINDSLNNNNDDNDDSNSCGCNRNEFFIPQNLNRRYRRWEGRFMDEKFW